jgi:asparagine synthase (glutamine-hydrolysing)
MCGIVGWVSFARDLRLQRPAIDAMTATMTRRGPDASMTWVTEHAALGHCRLAVIDVEGGQQPMVLSTPQGDVALTYSGELYNFVELRQELRNRGHQFRTTSDTEVVLHAYVEWGQDFAARLNGMYALGIWDARSETLLLMRDRIGIKPLYCYTTQDGVIFGSEPKGILACPLVPAHVDRDGLRELFVSRLLGKHTTPGSAVWSGMTELRPGTMTLTGREGTRVSQYWRLEAAPLETDAARAIQTVDELLRDIVNRQMISDVPICSLLSGGLDSSALAAIAARHSSLAGEPLRTFVVDFADYDKHFKVDKLRNDVGRMSHDAPVAGEAAAFIGTRHTRVVLDADTLADPATRADTVAARDLPSWFGNRDYSAYSLFKAVRQDATVALSGESADEVFGGYPWMADTAALDDQRLPWLTRQGMMPGAGSLLGIYNPEFAALLDVGATMRERYETAIAEAPECEADTAVERGHRKLAYMALARFVRNLLEKKDRMSMATGLEVRVPFCDHRLVEYLFNTQWAVKRFDGQEKSLLRSVVKGAIPDSVATRKKSPWPDIQHPRFYALLQEQLTELASQPKERIFDIFDHQAVTELTKIPLDQFGSAERAACERVLEVSTWLQIRNPDLEL